MSRVVLTLPRAEAKLVVGSPVVSLTLPRQAAVLSVGAPAVPLTLPNQRALLVCDDALDTDGFVTPTLTGWSVLAEDLEASGARVSVVELTTAGSPCRVKLSLVHASASETYSTKYSSPDQLTPHTGIFTTILATADRGLTYDLYWSWTSGNESAGPTLVAAAAVYVPLTGEGDFPAEA